MFEEFSFGSSPPSTTSALVHRQQDDEEEDVGPLSHHNSPFPSPRIMSRSISPFAVSNSELNSEKRASACYTSPPSSPRFDSSCLKLQNLTIQDTDPTASSTSETDTGATSYDRVRMQRQMMAKLQMEESQRADLATLVENMINNELGCSVTVVSSLKAPKRSSVSSLYPSPPSSSCEPGFVAGDGCDLNDDSVECPSSPTLSSSAATSKAQKSRVISDGGIRKASSVGHSAGATLAVCTSSGSSKSLRARKSLASLGVRQTRRMN